MEYKDYYYDDLRTQARSRGLRASGSKKDIIRRLKSQDRRRQSKQPSCRGILKEDCVDPCTWRSGTGCVYKKGKKGSPLGSLARRRRRASPPQETCRGIIREDCVDPCTWREGTGCVYKKGKKGSPLGLYRRKRINERSLPRPTRDQIEEQRNRLNRIKRTLSSPLRSPLRSPPRSGRSPTLAEIQEQRKRLNILPKQRAPVPPRSPLRRSGRSPTLAEIQEQRKRLNILPKQRAPVPLRSPLRRSGRSPTLAEIQEQRKRLKQQKGSKQQDEHKDHIYNDVMKRLSNLLVRMKKSVLDVSEIFPGDTLQDKLYNISVALGVTGEVSVLIALIRTFIEDYNKRNETSLVLSTKITQDLKFYDIVYEYVTYMYEKVLTTKAKLVVFVTELQDKFDKLLMQAKKDDISLKDFTLPEEDVDLLNLPRPYNFSIDNMSRGKVIQGPQRRLLDNKTGYLLPRRLQ
jgi:hypothetical protein